MKMDCTNSVYTIQPDFVAACKLANTEPTRRQASRFRMGKGRAFNVSQTIRRAPPVPSWFEPKMGSDTCPPEFVYLPEIPAEGETADAVILREEKDAKGAEEMAARTVEISEWKTRSRIQAREQWPKAWALKTLNL